MRKLLLCFLCLAAMLAAGTSLKAQEMTMELYPGWTWISYPSTDTLDLATAFGSFTPAAGDYIKSQAGYAEYYAGYGWYGSLSTFWPCKGYMYKSNRTEPVVVTLNIPLPQQTVTTAEPTDITATSAIVGSTVTIGEDDHIFARGVCWGTEQMPDVNGNRTTDATVTGSQTVTLNGLTPNTTYYVRAYVATDYGLAYGNQQSFATESGGSGPNPDGEVQNMPYMQSFISDFGTYMTYDAEGSQSWVIDYNTAKMSGYANGTNNANEDWLISSPVAITGVSVAKMTMVYIGRYFNNINEDVTIWASTDYSWGESPAFATWTQVSASLIQGTDWYNFLTAEIALTEYVGQTVTFAVRYTSTDSNAGTIEIESITIEEGNDYTNHTNLVLNELNGDTKFIEIYNMGDLDLPLEGMYIMKDGTNSIWTADNTIVAPAHGYVLLYSYDVQVDHPEQPLNLFFNSGLSAKKSLCITLFMPDGTVRDEFIRGTTDVWGSWGASISNVAPQSYARTPDGGDWKLADPTPGTANPTEGEDIPQE